MIYCYSIKPIRLREAAKRITWQRRSFEWHQQNVTLQMSQFILLATSFCLQLYHKSETPTMPFVFNLQRLSVFMANFRWKKNVVPLLQTVFLLFRNVSMETFWARLHAFPETRTNPLTALFTSDQNSLPPFPPSIFQRQTHTSTGQVLTQQKTQYPTGWNLNCLFVIFSISEQTEMVLPCEWWAPIGCAATKCSILEVKSESHQIKEG